MSAFEYDICVLPVAGCRLANIMSATAAGHQL